MPGTPDHPDPGLIAAHAEKRLTGPDAARLDEHLASCSECFEVFAETARSVIEDEAGEVVPERPGRPGPAARPGWRWGAGLAAAAGLFFATHQVLRWADPGGGGSTGARGEAPSPMVAELARAMGTKRVIEARLTGGFEHGRLVVLRAGDESRPQGLDAHSPAVLTAVARIREWADGDTSPEALGALGLTFLVSGDLGRAIHALESATAQAPENARLQSDLAAAYLARASLAEPADLPRALEAAERAVARPDAPAEAWWNRALALEKLHLADSARKAWEDFLERDSTSAWADEARKRLEDLSSRRSTLEDVRGRAHTAVAQGEAAIDALADAEPWILADYFVTGLLPAWADASLAGHPSLAAIRDQAGQAGEALLRTTGDSLALDAARALPLPVSGPSRDPPHFLAQGFKTLDEAQRLYEEGRACCENFRESQRLLRAGGSPFELWARERATTACLSVTKPASSRAAYVRIEHEARRRGYGALLGRAHWMQGLLDSDEGAFDPSLRHYRASVNVYRRSRDPRNEAAVTLRLAFTLQASGEGAAAWRERLRALELADSLPRDARQDEFAVFSVAFAAWHDGLARAAVHGLTEMVDATRRRGDPARLGTALVWRADLLLGLGSDERAASDLDEVRAIAAPHPPFGDQLLGSADAADGRRLASVEPERALACLRRAIPYFEHNLPVRVPDLRVRAARILRARGTADEAEAELEQAIGGIESQQASLADARHQAIFFDFAAALPFDEMVALQLDARDDPERALYYVERSRGRQLAASLLSRSEAGASRVEPIPASDPPPLAPQELRDALPPGAALAYYVRLPDQVVAFVLDRAGSRAFRLPAAPDALERRVAGYAAAIGAAAPVRDLHQQSGELFDLLVRPLLPALAGRDSLVIVPDGFLRSLAFASLWNRDTGRYLVEDYRLGQSASGTALVRASGTTLSPGRAGRLLAVGNPRLGPGSGLPDLAGSEAEAGEIARLYPEPELLLGPAATRRAVLGAIARHDVLHFAGHAEADSPAGRGLLLAREKGDQAPGVLRADEVLTSDLGRVRLVVLAGCRTASGAQSRFEGALGAARPFLAAGVPMVVGSLWDLDDLASPSLLVDFHRRFLELGDAAAALRAAQVASLRGSDPGHAHPSRWAGFVSLGGLFPPAAAASEENRPAS